MGIGLAVLYTASPRQLCAGLAPKAAPDAQPDAAPEPSPEDAPVLAALQEAMNEVDALREEVDAGRPVKGFGERALEILEATPKELQPAVDGALQGLFIEQLAMVHRDVLEQFESDRKPATALQRADKEFIRRAEDIRLPGSDWTYEPERQVLLKALDSAYRQDATLKQERARSAQTQRATAAVVGKLQKQMEQVAEKLSGVGASSPWVLWTSYRIPGTPLRMSGRYQQGRTNIEFSLSPNKDPANAEAGFVEGLTKQNLGLSLNVGV